MPLPPKKLLTADEERELSVRIQRGDIEARNELVECNLRLVVSIAKRFLGRGVPFEDLMQEGVLGLIKATSTFDPDKGRFTTYATGWVRRFVINALKRRFVISIPFYVQASQNEPGMGQSQEPLVRSDVFSETVSDHRFTESIEVQEDLARLAVVVGRLPEREAKVIRRRFGIDCEPTTLRELSSESGVTKQRIQQIAACALADLKEAMT